MLELKKLYLLKSKHRTQARKHMLHNNQHVKRVTLNNYHVNSNDFYLTLFNVNLLYKLNSPK